MAGAAGTDLLVGRVAFAAGGVARFGTDDAGQLFKIGFAAPETAAGKNRGRGFPLIGRRRIGRQSVAADSCHAQ